MEFFKCRNSSGIHFNHLRSDNETTNFVVTASFHMGVKCHFGSYNVTLTGSILAIESPDEENITVTFLSTSCRDCLVMHIDSEPKHSTFSAGRQVNAKEAEEFKAQVECLNMLPPAAMDPAVQLCQREEKHGCRSEPSQKKASFEI